jgi:hypothetical protein
MESTDVVRHPLNRRIAIITTVTVIAAMSVIVALAITSTSIGPSDFTTLPPHTSTQPLLSPVGTPDKAELSGMGLPGPKALPGYTMLYASNFPGKSLPAGWASYSGPPANDRGAEYAITHVVVRGDSLRINTWRDPDFQNRWVTGGVCQCGLPQTYGAFFVRSRDTGGGATSVQLLYPESNVWPPEVDFNENEGQVNSTTSTIHFGPADQLDQRVLHINMLQWHTWGIIWSPTSIKYTVDGVLWASVNTAAEIPTIPMRLSLQQQTFCLQGRVCPSAPVSMLVNWVAEYRAT